MFSSKNIKKVGIIHSDVKREYFPTEQQYITEKSAIEDAEKVANCLRATGVEVEIFPGNETLVEKLGSSKPDVVFNCVDSVKGFEYLTAAIPGLLEMLDVPYTGAGMLGLALCYNKFLTKKMLKNGGVPVPNTQLFFDPMEPLDIEMRFPLISKLNEIHGSVEMGSDAVSENEDQLRDRLRRLIKTYDQPVLVEEYIAGKEITVMVMDNDVTRVFLSEKAFNQTKEKYDFVTFDDQWAQASTDRSTWSYSYKKFEDPNLEELGKKAFDLIKMEDYGKFDVRQDASGRYFFVDSNPNPSFGPKEMLTDIGLIIEEMYEVPFSEILSHIMTNAIKRHNSEGSFSIQQALTQQIFGVDQNS